MGLVAPHRRYWIVLVLVLLALPMLVQAVTPRARVSEREARTLAPLPPSPRSLKDWLALPRALDRFLIDHFGLREALVRANARLRYAVYSPTDLRVVYGRDGYLFFNGDGLIQQSMGLFLRRADVDKFADRAAALQASFRARNIEFLVTVPPNSATIARAHLPGWAANVPALTEYDLMMTALAKRNVTAVDLRPALRAADANAPMYREKDTHWTQLGALFAYNSVVAKLGRPEWTVDPGPVFRGIENAPVGDLARMLGVSADVHDTDTRIDLSSYAAMPLRVTALNTGHDGGGDITETGRPGPTVLILGDSFTQHYWRELFALFAGRVVWMHHEYCGFERSVIDAQAPDIVILAPTERSMFCWAG